jgi:hypothetical protein
MMLISKLTIKSLEILLVSLWKLVIKKPISYVIGCQWPGNQFQIVY